MSIQDWLQGECPEKGELSEEAYMFYGEFTPLGIWPVSLTREDDDE